MSARGRSHEMVNRIRRVRTRRYKLIRNDYPDRPYTQRTACKERQCPVLNLMKQLHAEGKVSSDQVLLMASTRPMAELRDLQSDPHEVRNLPTSPQHLATLKELQQELDRWILETRNQGAVPEDAATIEKQK